MRLTISNLRKDDFGYYHCVARNELNATMVNFEIARRSNRLLATFFNHIELPSLPTLKQLKIPTAKHHMWATMSRSMASDRQRASVQSAISARIPGESRVTNIPRSTKQRPFL